MELQVFVTFACVLLPGVLGQVDFAAMLGSLGFGGGPGGAGGPPPRGSSSCPYQAHPNKFKFTQNVNNRIMTQDCAPGTMFDINKCSCVTSTNKGPTPGSNPMMEAAFRGGAGENPLLGLLAQLQGGGGPPGMPKMPTRSTASARPAPPPFRTMSRPTRVLPGRVSDALANHGRGLSVDLTNTRDRSSSAPIRYSPRSGSSASLKPIVDTSMLPDIIPHEVLKMLNIATSPSGGVKPSTPAPRKVAKAAAGPISLAPSSMFNKAQARSTSGSSVPLPKSVLKAMNMAIPSALNPSSGKASDKNRKNVLAPELMNMIKKSMNTPMPKPTPRAPTRGSSRQHYTPMPKTPSPSGRPASFSYTPEPRRPTQTRSFMSQTRSNNGGRPPRQNGGGGGFPFGGNNNNKGGSLASLFGGNSGNGGNPLDALFASMAGGMGGGNGGRGPGSQQPPMASLMAMMNGGGPGNGMGGGPGGDPFAELMARMTGAPTRAPPQGPMPGGPPGMADAFAAIMAAGPGPSGFGTGPDMSALLRSIGGPSPPSQSGGNPFGGAGGNPFGAPGGAAAGMMSGIMGATAAGMPPTDMTNFFNTQGRMGMGMASAANMDMFKLQQLDRQGVIDISDLTPQGLMAANAHFAG